MLTDEQRARILARYRRLRGRGVELCFVTTGKLVKASTPEELQEAAALALHRDGEPRD